MRLIERVIGGRHDDGLADALHRLEHRGAVDVLVLKAAETERRRFRATTGGGEEVMVALPRDQHLHDGAVLVLEPDRALVVRVATTRWMRVAARDAAAALELGYHAGNLHWRVRFEGDVLLVALEGPAEAYRARLRRLLDAGAAVVETNGGDEAC